MKAILGRVLWGVVTGLWPAVTALRAEFPMHWWHSYLTWALALAEAACALALRVRARARERERERARDQDAEHRITDLEARVGAYEQALAAMADYGQAGDFRACSHPGPARLRLVRKRA